MSILQLSLSNLSSLYSICRPTHLFLTLTTPCKPTKSTVIRMGGGPRTFPGGVSKWQWKRMQAKKSKQLLKARIARERQIYEMRKRAELKAAVSELERPWEPVEKAPALFSAPADEQLKVLADRFQKAGGFDLWSEKNGPELFETVNGVNSARFLPKGVVHSAKPYGRIGGGDSDSGSGFDLNRVLENGGGDRNAYGRIGDDGLSASGSSRVSGSGNGNGNVRTERKGYRRNDGNLDGDGVLNSVSDAGVSEDVNGYGKIRTGRNWSRRIRDGLCDSDDDELGELDLGLDLDLESGVGGKMGLKISRNTQSGSVREGDCKGAINSSGNEDSYNGKYMRKVTGKRPGFRDSRSGSFNQEEESGSKVNGRRSGFGDSRSGSIRAIRTNGGRFSRGKGSRKLKSPNSEVFDMSMQNDGSYEFSNSDLEILKGRKAEQ